MTGSTLVPNVHQNPHWQMTSLSHFTNLPSLFALWTITKKYSGKREVKTYLKLMVSLTISGIMCHVSTGGFFLMAYALDIKLHILPSRTE